VDRLLIDPETEAQACDLGLLELGLPPLAEAGGVVSWLRRGLTNVDRAAERELRGDMARVRTARDRDRLLDEIDVFLKEARQVRADGTLGDLLRAFGLGGAASGLAAAGGWIRGVKTAAAALPPAVAPGLMARLLGLGPTQAAAQTAAYTAARGAHIVGMAGRFAGWGFAGASALSFVLKTVYRYNGNLDDYVAALEDLRARVAAMDVKG
jgi:hypothetical protein